MELQAVSKGFLKIKWKKTQINVTSEIQIGESIVKSSGWERH